MNKIIKLPKQLSDKIAAGEVVTGPVSVVKELVENSIDAGACSINIEIKGGGKSYIRVTDNGSGISSDDVKLAFSPHATSKILTEDDLNSINTLGFRGEALTSIAAVSKLEMITMTEDERIGTSIYIEGGDIIEMKDIGTNRGTTIIVRDLYYNTPARLKFMKSDRSESTKIIDLISRIAIAYPKIKIRMISNENILFSTNGKGDVSTNIFQVYGEVSEGDLLTLNETDGNYALKAYISPSNHTNKSRKNQIYFVNGRVVNSKTIENAVTKGYEEFIFEGRYPVVFVFLEVNPQKLDVNVHPAKTEVRFDEKNTVSSFITNSIHNRLKTKDAIPAAITPSQKNIKKQGKSIFNLNESERNLPGIENGKKTENVKSNSKIDKTVSKVEQVNIKSLLSNPPTENQSDIKSVAEPKTEEYELSDIEKNITSPKDAPDISNLNVLGSIFATYILATDDDIFYIIDQHAAHERVNYELFLNQYRSDDKLSQQLLEPLIHNVSLTSMNSIESWLRFINRLGYEAEIFGDRSIIIKAVPAFLDLTQADDMLGDILDDIGQKVPENNKAIENLIQRSCKASVKANDLLKPAEVKSLLKDLSKCDNPFACPHGRPVFIKLSKYDVEKLFRRV